MKISFQRAVRCASSAFQLALLGTLILTTRCANYEDVFVAGNVYFTDADCYARMTRVRICSEHPGLIVRHHDFENFRTGTTPHTTAPLDYLILALSILLKPFTAHGIDLAGALISPLLALLGGWFLWWWSVKFRYRWVMLILYAISPIVVHGTELGRPDHQSLLILLVMVALCAEWSLQSLEALRTRRDAIRESRMPWQRRAWSGVGAAAWALAIWVSVYEPLVLFLIVTATIFLANRQALFGRDRRTGWILFAAIIVAAILIERRIPWFTIFHSNEIFKNWSRSVGELAHVSPVNPIWFHWTGYMIAVAPLLIWFDLRESRSKSESAPLFIVVLLIATYFLTIWQARWAYFFLLLFAIALPALLEPIKSRVAVWIAFMLSIWPILRDWDARLWPNEAEFARRIEQRNDSVQLRELAINLKSSETHPFLAPWWLSPSIAYWSGQPGVAGSSHESLNGITESARFFISNDWQEAREILEHRRVAWVIAYDYERVAQNSSAILGLALPQRPLCFVLDRTPAQAPQFLVLSAQNGVGKLYRTAGQ